MRTKKVIHSKVKNAGILFELLSRQLTVELLSGKQSPAITIMQKYFRKDKELGKELQLYRTFFEMSRLSESKAIQFVDFITTQRKKLDETQLIREKYNLIKEIKEYYNLTEFLSARIPSYKLYASIYKTFLAETKEFDVTNLREIAISRFTLIEHLAQDKKIVKANISSEDALLEEFKNQTEDLRLLSYKLLHEKFNERYQDLAPRQKNLLREYIYSISNSDKFNNFVQSEIEPLRVELSSLAKKEDDKVLQIKLNEVASQIGMLKNKKNIKDNELTCMMIAYQLIEELGS